MFSELMGFFCFALLLSFGADQVVRGSYNSHSFENDLKRLEELVNKMESGDATLEESLVWFEQGMDLIRSCQAQLNNAEQKVQELIQNTDGKIDIKDTK